MIRNGVCDRKEKYGSKDVKEIKKTKMNSVEGLENITAMQHLKGIDIGERNEYNKIRKKEQRNL